VAAAAQTGSHPLTSLASSLGGFTKPVAQNIIDSTLPIANCTAQHSTAPVTQQVGRGERKLKTNTLRGENIYNKEHA
jgi:hypothetical protein